MKCQCCSKEDYAENMCQCPKCLAVLCEECFLFHTNVLPEAKHLCITCPLPQREEIVKSESKEHTD